MSDEISTQPFAAMKFKTIHGSRMAYIDEGEGDPIVFQHGNPTSSYLWRNVMPHLRGMGRLIACDLIGMGDSDKLSPSGPDRYHYEEQRQYLHGLWDALDLGDKVVLVIHDWGSALGFDWAMRNPSRVQGLAYMESLVGPMTSADVPPTTRKQFEGGLRAPGMEKMFLDGNLFVERLLNGSINRPMKPEEQAEYRKPYLNPGEDRRPTMSWPLNVPMNGEPAEMVRVAEAYGAFMARAAFPKLFINVEPGAILTGRLREFCRTWPNQTEVTLQGGHFIQEEKPHEVGRALADFVRRVRGKTAS